MSTTPFNPTSLNTPSTAAQWSLVTVSLATYSNNPGVLVLFRATAGTSPGNSVWLDNINLYNAPATGIKSVSANTNDFSVFPNPATAETNISINAVNNSDVKISVTNALGQVVYNKAHPITAGNNNFQLDCKNLAEGVYLINMECDKNTVTKKLVITK